MLASDKSTATMTRQALWQRGCRIARLSSLEEMSALLDSVVVRMNDWGYAGRDTFCVRLALDEAVTNAIKHGHQFDPGKTVQVRYAINQEYALFEVTDEGPGFDPTLVPDPTSAENMERTGGRGLLLIQFYMSWVRYNQRGNTITFCKYSSTPLSTSEMDAPR